MSLKHLVLALLRERPKSGYEIDTDYRDVIQFFWGAKQRQIYNVLAQLHDKGWVTVEEVVQTRAPDKKLYHISPSGQQELERWLNTPLPRLPVRLDWLGQIYFSNEHPVALTLQQLQTRRDILDNRLEQLESTLHEFELIVNNTPVDDLSRDTLQYLTTLHFGVRNIASQITWLEDMIEAFTSLEDGEAVPGVIARAQLMEMQAIYHLREEENAAKKADDV